MRCPNCGGLTKTYLTDTDGNSYFHCTNGVTSPKVNHEERGHILACFTLIDHQGKIVPSGVHIMYITDGQVKSLKT